MHVSRLQTLTTEAEAKEFEAEGEAVVIGLFKSADSDQAKAFMSTANGIDRLPFATASSEEVSERDFILPLCAVRRVLLKIF